MFHSAENQGDRHVHNYDDGTHSFSDQNVSFIYTGEQTVTFKDDNVSFSFTTDELCNERVKCDRTELLNDGDDGIIMNLNL